MLAANEIALFNNRLYRFDMRLHQRLNTCHVQQMTKILSMLMEGIYTKLTILSIWFAILGWLTNANYEKKKCSLDEVERTN